MPRPLHLQLQLPSHGVLYLQHYRLQRLLLLSRRFCLFELRCGNLPDRNRLIELHILRRG